MDENADVQIVHTKKEFRNLRDQSEGLGEMNDYYRSLIKSKIGHPENPPPKQQSSLPR